MSQTILLATDSSVIRQTINQFLEETGYQVIDAASGQEVLTHLNCQEHVDMVIMDTNLKDMDSMQLAKQIRDITMFRFLPIVVLTNSKNKSLELEGLSAGITGWLCQPVTIEQIQAIIKRLLC